MDYRYTAQEPKYSQNYNANEQTYEQPATQSAAYSQDTGYPARKQPAFGQTDYSYQDPTTYDAYQDPNYAQGSTGPSLTDINSHES